MTYHTLKCPHCKNIVNRATGSPSYIGNPFRKCPWCGGDMLTHSRKSGQQNRLFRE